MKKIIFFLCFYIAGILSYSQPVTTPPKKQPVKTNPSPSKPVAITVDKKITPPDRITPICFGKIGMDGTILNGTRNFTVKRVSAGNYDITCVGIREHSIVLLHSRSDVRYMTHSNYCHVTVSVNGDDEDGSFNFVIYDPGQ